MWNPSSQNRRKNEIVLLNELKSTRTDITTSRLTVHETLNGLEGNLSTKQDHTNTLVHSQTTLIHQMIKMTQDQHQELLERIPNLTLEQTDDDGFVFQGDNLGSIVLPLLLMKSPLFKTIKTLQKEGTLKISCSEADWILQHFDKLLAKGHRAAAKALERRPGSSLNQGQKQIFDIIKVPASTQISHIKHMSTIYTSSGDLILQIGSSNKPKKCHQNAEDLQVIHLYFFPKPEFSLVNLCMLMTNDFGRDNEPQIPRLIQTYNTLQLESETTILIVNLIIKDKAKDLENFFRSIGGSPKDILENGLSLSQVSTHLTL